MGYHDKQYPIKDKDWTWEGQTNLDFGVGVTGTSNYLQENPEGSSDFVDPGFTGFLVMMKLEFQECLEKLSLHS